MTHDDNLSLMTNRCPSWEITAYATLSYFYTNATSKTSMWGCRVNEFLVIISFVTVNNNDGLTAMYIHVSRVCNTLIMVIYNVYHTLCADYCSNVALGYGTYQSCLTIHDTMRPLLTSYSTNLTMTMGALIDEWRHLLAGCATNVSATTALHITCTSMYARTHVHIPQLTTTNTCFVMRHTQGYLLLHFKVHVVLFAARTRYLMIHYLTTRQVDLIYCEFCGIIMDSSLISLVLLSDVILTCQIELYISRQCVYEYVPAVCNSESHSQPGMFYCVTLTLYVLLYLLSGTLDGDRALLYAHLEYFSYADCYLGSYDIRRCYPSLFKYENVPWPYAIPLSLKCMYMLGSPGLGPRVGHCLCSDTHGYVMKMSSLGVLNKQMYLVIWMPFCVVCNGSGLSFVSMESCPLCFVMNVIIYITYYEIYEDILIYYVYSICHLYHE